MYKTHAINELSFPKTAHEIQARRTPDHVIYGGAARSALLESQSTPLIPIRDIDEIPINQVDGQSFFTKIGDFSIDQALVLGNGELTLYITDQAQEAAAQRCIEPTDDRINAARKLEELHKAKPEDIALSPAINAFTEFAPISQHEHFILQPSPRRQASR